MVDAVRLEKVLRQIGRQSAGEPEFKPFFCSFTNNSNQPKQWTPSSGNASFQAALALRRSLTELVSGACTASQSLDICLECSQGMDDGSGRKRRRRERRIELTICQI